MQSSMDHHQHLPNQPSSLIAKKFEECKQFILTNPLPVAQFLVCDVMIILFIVFMCGEPSERREITTIALIIKIVLTLCASSMYFIKSKVAIAVLAFLTLLSLTVGSVLGFLGLFPFHGKVANDSMITLPAIVITCSETATFVLDIAMFFKIKKLEQEEQQPSVSGITHEEQEQVV